MGANQASSATVLEPRLKEDEPDEKMSAAELTLGLVSQSKHYAWKRLFDLAIGVPLAIIALPIVAIAALVVVITSGWPGLLRCKAGWPQRT